MFVALKPAIIELCWLLFCSSFWIWMLILALSVSRVAALVVLVPTLPAESTLGFMFLAKEVPGTVEFTLNWSNILG
jgi:hypothetical protein